MRLGPGGRLEVVRRAPPADPASLRAAAGALRAAADAGAVEVRAVHDDGSVVELVVAYAGRPLEPPVDAATAIATMAAVAGHLADGQLRGLAHGAIELDHILRDGDGTVRLTGFVPGASDGARDVGALGRVLLSLLDDDDHGDAARAARSVAARCLTDDPTARPTAAAVAASLAALGPRREVAPRTSLATTDGSGRRRSRSGSGRGASLATALGTLAVVAIVVGALALPREGGDPPPALAPTTTTAARGASTSTTPTTTPRSTRVWPARTATDDSTQPPVIEGGGSTWTWDRAGMQSVLADLDCDGVQTPVALDANGDVWHIAAWPEGSAVAASHLTTVRDALRIDVERGRCDRLVVVTRRGEVRPVASAGARPRSRGAVRRA